MRSHVNKIDIEMCWKICEAVSQECDAKEECEAFFKRHMYIDNYLCHTRSEFFEELRHIISAITELYDNIKEANEKEAEVEDGECRCDEE